MARVRAKAALSLALLATALAPCAAGAHALLLESTPADGAVLSAAPARAELRWDSRIERKLARVALDGPDGKEVALAPDPGEARPDRISLALPRLAAGSYRLTWRVLAVDGHASFGQIRFTIRPGSAAP